MQTHTNSKSAFSTYIAYTWYIQSLYLIMHFIWHVHRFVLRVSLHSMPLIALPRSHLMASRTTRQTQMMKLILIFPIHKRCWRDSCRICPSWQMMRTGTIWRPQQSSRPFKLYHCQIHHHCRGEREGCDTGSRWRYPAAASVQSVWDEVIQACYRP